MSSESDLKEEILALLKAEMFVINETVEDALTDFVSVVVDESETRDDDLLDDEEEVYEGIDDED